MNWDPTARFGANYCDFALRKKKIKLNRNMLGTLTRKQISKTEGLTFVVDTGREETTRLSWKKDSEVLLLYLLTSLKRTSPVATE